MTAPTLADQIEAVEVYVIEAERVDSAYVLALRAAAASLRLLNARPASLRGEVATYLQLDARTAALREIATYLQLALRDADVSVPLDIARTALGDKE